MKTCPRCGEDYNGILCQKCGYTPFPEDEPTFDRDEPLTEPEKVLVVKQAQQNDSSCTSRYVWSFLLPIVGIILGAILLSKPEKDSRSSGTFCLIWAVISLVLFGTIGFVCWISIIA